MTLRPILALALALMMAVTAQAAAIARGMPGAAGYAELCTGTGPVMVAIDADGQPIGHAHLCPDNAFLILQAIALPPVLPVPVARIGRLERTPYSTSAHARLSPTAIARGPPVPS
ncbi:hypothetical protein [Oceanicola sp. 22II-s10i]|uniref:hypothetical protein n=1 Tax=Oceanicola sp. 22II-s10i TaxID=1317116 RepID=UPI000B528850|nr:hypothetical protein [Oceanicola sp. 22II-s10i]